MVLPADLPIVDHHCHLHPNGEGVGAARRFASAGGSHLMLATQNYTGSTPDTLDAYRSQFQTTLDLATTIRREVGIEVRCVMAPYPIDLIHAAPRLGLESAVDLQTAALDLAGRWVAEGLAVALGEVGLPHFPVEASLQAATERVFDHALGVARDRDCPVVVHSADLDAAGYRALAERARRAGLAAGRVVKHYARSVVPASERAEIPPSVLARRELVNEVLATPGPWFLETDFLDDPARPGAVLDLATVPRRAAAIAARGAEDTERLWVPFVRSFEQVYGWRPERPVPGGP